ncbi:MAG: VWA domain-containing protein [Zoogloea sp.]|uniref:VWA domain-containing protein n=1 Tax=Zoogloea sp. TaxID=49181 RepID=UPI002614871D|nr:VWA domain-containing protein [Zoogloea sp.]MDD2991072.1 VWA domain-containing protein [Zoogloea sp.]
MVGESVELTLGYAETLAWNGKRLRFRLPTTIAPRYGQPTGMQPWQRPETSLAAEYPFSLTISIPEPLSGSAVFCPTHQVRLKSTPEGLLVSLAQGAAMDRDFILDIENDAVQSVGVSASARDTHLVMLTLLPPAVESSSKERDVVLVIDCSGSMQGDSLSLAKEGVMLALGSLAPNERFGLIAFGTDFEKFDETLQPANHNNLEMARRWLEHLGNLGGTDINGALERALDLHDAQPMDILLLTDGQDWQAGAAIPEAKKKGVRIFPMGIGSAVAEESLHAMADETGGACELITPMEDMSMRIHRHFNRMRQPQMSRLDIAWPSLPMWECRPAHACFAGDAYTVFAAFHTPIHEPVQVSFQFGQHEPQVSLTTLAQDTHSADALVRVGARQRLSALLESDRQSWAIAHQLITSQTDYLITVERTADEKASQLPELQIQPNMLPAGWGGSSSVHSSAGASHSGSESVPAISRCVRPPRSVESSEPPAFFRRQRRAPEELALEVGSLELERLIQHLNSRSRRIAIGGFPKTLAKLRSMPVPKQVQALFEELLGEDLSEAIILQSFYAALLQHTGSNELREEFKLKALEVVNAGPLNSIVVERIVALLDSLTNARLSTFAWDIPAFLRKAAD